MKPAEPATDGETVYKITDLGRWREAATDGHYRGSADDARDGFIHLSTAAQLPGTARKHFAGKPDLLLVAFDAASLGPALAWEPSRGGALFPHLYGALPVRLALWVEPVALDGDGVPLIAAALERAAARNERPGGPTSADGEAEGASPDLCCARNETRTDEPS